MQPCVRDPGVPLCPWKSGSTELFLLQPCRICLLVCLYHAHISPGQFLIARASKGHYKPLSGFISPTSKKTFSPPPPLPGASPTSAEERSGSSAHSSWRCLPPRISAGTWRGNNPWFHPSCSTTQSNIACSLSSVTTTSSPLSPAGLLVLGGLFLLMLLQVMGALTVPPPYVPVALPESVA